MKNIRDDRGMVIVEATIVFPVCFIIILMLLYLGNVYYQKSRIEAIVVEAALDGAAYCADPVLKTIESSENHAVPKLGSVSYEPYRYLGGMFGGMDKIENSVAELIRSRIGGMSTGLFSGMKPTGYNTGGLKVEYKSCFVASSICVDLEYQIELPIRLLGDKDNLSMKFQTHTEVPVEDPTEFIRNVNMVEDILEVTGIKAKITDKIKELKGFFDDLFH